MSSKLQLSIRELSAFQAFLNNMRILRRRTKRPAIVAMVGLSGSGKSSVASEISRVIGGTVIEGDEIRMELRKRKVSYNNVHFMVDMAVAEVLRGGGNPVIDSDFIDSSKRRTTLSQARRAGAQTCFVRVVCDRDIMIGRILWSGTNDFFEGAATPWKGSGRERGIVIKLREFWRRTPLHYRWSAKDGGNGN